MGPEAKGILYAWATAFIVFGIYQLILWIKTRREDKLFWKQVDANIERIDKEFKDAIYKALEAAVIKTITDHYLELFDKTAKGEKEDKDGTTN
jgi:Ca2+/H+ antiporter